MGVPQSSVGAPCPLIVGDGLRVVLAYYVQNTPPDWDGTLARMVGPTTEGQPVAIVRFDLCRAHFLGAPNDEAFEGHPLSGRGLAPYGCFEIQNSSWIRRLERMNSVHRAHRAEDFWKLRHLVFSFHDETFECVCGGFEVAEVAPGSISAMVPQLIRHLRWDAA
jgi:hypothetical protein